MSHSDPETPPDVPRWVKVFVLVVVLLLLLVVAIMFIAGGDHGPGRHTPGMVTGFTALTVRSGLGRPALGEDASNGDVVPSEDHH